MMITLNTLGIQIQMNEITVKNQLPLLYTVEFDFCEGHVLDISCYVLHFKGTNFSASKTHRMLKKVTELLEITIPCILWLNKISAKNIERLIGYRQPFFVNDKMVFLPFLGACLDDRFARLEKRLPPKFTTATQCVFFWLLYHNSEYCPTDMIMRDLRLSQASVSRALVQLERYELLSFDGKATRKRYYRKDVQEFWEGGKQYLSNPVLKTYYLEDVSLLADVKSYASGEEALAAMSMLQPPEIGCKAISKLDYQKLKSSLVDDPELLDSEIYIKIEIWDYDPELFACLSKSTCPDANRVDLFSLYASLGDLLNDARIEIEIEKLVEDFINGTGY